MRLLNSLWIAFGMYSKIPTPKVEWDEKNMKYVMCFFPIIGVIIGLIQCGWFWLCDRAYILEIPWLIGGAVAMVIPLLLTGGIHMDGYLDTCDALASYGNQEQKRKILKDTHVGAFAIIRGGVYLIISFAGWSSLLGKGVCPMFFCVCIGFILSRALSGMSVVVFPLASNSGFVSLFSEASRKWVVRITMAVFICCCVVSMILVGGIAGMVILGVLGLHYGSYYRMTKIEFGGINGDTCGYYLQQAELLILIMGGLL